MSVVNRIDVHQHVVPPFWVSALAAHGGDPSGWYSPSWTPDSAIAFMDSQQIATGVLSLTAPGVMGWMGPERRDMARRVNEYTAGLVASQPSRFGNFATLPLPDVDGALIELEYALGTLAADGIVLLSNYDGHYLGDPLFEPLWAELNRRGTVVFVHPGKPAIPIIEGIPGPIVDYPFDTTRTAVQMVLNGVLDRYRNTPVILSHAGGFLPFASHRFAQAAAAAHPGKRDPEAILESFRRFYFDTALSASPAALPSLLAFTHGQKVLFGSDYPYAPATLGAYFTSNLDGYADLTTEARASINNQTARSLFPRLRAMRNA
jgi:predicted TIM-barrel fold metal-dependent hydrolase